MVSILVVHADASLSADDTNLINFLTGRGHTVAQSSEVNALPNSGYDLAIITSSGDPGSAAIGSIPGCQLPVMLFETNWVTARLSTAAATTNTSSAQYSLTNHSVNNDHISPLTVFSSSQTLFGVSTPNLASGVEVLATAPTVSSHATAVFAGTGAQLTTGTAPNRRCAMGLVAHRLSQCITQAPDWLEDVILLTAGASTPSNQAIAYKWGYEAYTSTLFPTANSFVPSRGPIANGDYVLLWINSPQSVSPSSVPSGFVLVQTWSNTRGYLLLYRKYITNAASEPASWEIRFPQQIEGGMVLLCYSGVDSNGLGSYDAITDATASDNTYINAPNIAGAGGPQRLVVHCGISNDYPFDFSTDISEVTEADVPTGAGPLNTRAQINSDMVGEGQAYSLFTYDRDLGSAAPGSNTGSLSMNMYSALANIGATVVLLPAPLTAAAPATIRRTVAFGSPTVGPVGTGASINATSIARRVEIPTPSVGVDRITSNWSERVAATTPVGSWSASPATISRTVEFPVLSVDLNRVTSAWSSSVQATTLTGAGTVSPATISRTISFGGQSTTIPRTIPFTVGVSAGPTVTVGTTVGASPATISRVASFSIPIAAVGVRVASDWSSSVQATTLIDVPDDTAMPTTINRTVITRTPTVAASVVGTPITGTTISRTVSFPARTVRGGSVVAAVAIRPQVVTVTRLAPISMWALNAKATFDSPTSAGSITQSTTASDIVNFATPGADVFKDTTAAQIIT